VAVAELEGRPVVVSSGSGCTVRAWDLAASSPVGEPFTGHADTVFAVAVVELDGCPVVVSGSGDGIVRVWDLTARRAVQSHLRPVHLHRPAPFLLQSPCSARIVLISSPAVWTMSATHGSYLVAENCPQRP